MQKRSGKTWVQDSATDLQGCKSEAEFNEVCKSAAEFDEALILPESGGKFTIPRSADAVFGTTVFSMAVFGTAVFGTAVFGTVAALDAALDARIGSVV